MRWGSIHWNDFPRAFERHQNEIPVPSVFTTSMVKNMKSSIASLVQSMSSELTGSSNQLATKRGSLREMPSIRARVQNNQCCQCMNF